MRDETWVRKEKAGILQGMLTLALAEDDLGRAQSLVRSMEGNGIDPSIPYLVARGVAGSGPETIKELMAFDHISSSMMLLDESGQPIN